MSIFVTSQQEVLHRGVSAGPKYQSHRATLPIGIAPIFAACFLFLALAPGTAKAQVAPINCDVTFTGSYDYGADCSLQELFDNPGFGGAYYLTSQGYRVFGFELFDTLIELLGDPSRIKVIVEDGDPENPRVRFAPDPGVTTNSAGDPDFNISGGLRELKGRFQIFGPLTVSAIKIDAEFSSTFESNTGPRFECGDYEGGAAVFSANANDGFNPPQNGNAVVFSPPEFFPNGSLKPSGIIDPPVATIAVIGFSLGTIVCDEQQTAYQGFAQIDSAEITIGLGGGFLPRPNFAGLINDNSFENGLNAWTIDESGGCSALPGVGYVNLDCDGSDPNGAITLTQTINTPAQSYEILFDHRFSAPTGVLVLTLIPPLSSGIAPEILQVVQAPADLPGYFTRVRTLVNNVTLMDLVGATLEVKLLPGSPAGAQITNVGVYEAPAGSFGFATSALLWNEFRDSVFGSDVDEIQNFGATAAEISNVKQFAGDVDVVGTSTAKSELIVGGPFDGVTKVGTLAKLDLPTFPTVIDNTPQFIDRVSYRHEAEGKGSHSFRVVPDDPSNPPPAGTLVDVNLAWSFSGSLSPGIRVPLSPSAFNTLGDSYVFGAVALNTKHTAQSLFFGKIVATGVYSDLCCAIIGLHDFANAEAFNEAFIDVDPDTGHPVVGVESNRTLMNVVKVPVFDSISTDYQMLVAMDGSISEGDEIAANPFAKFDQSFELVLSTDTPGVRIVPAVNGPSDDDNDGVNNNQDLCPGTAAGAMVDANGCAQSQLDDDNDGVSNDQDLCPGTAAGAVVDANGCAQSQLDDDNDGVNNDQDLCPGTAAGAMVDANGCAQSQLDDDNDGVNNDQDLCPGTPVGSIVDADGCAQSQLDSDGDGITNDLDICHGTAIPEAVPASFLRKNRYALTGQPNATTFEGKNKTVFTTADTGGCSCEQIIAAMGLGGGHTEFGCSKSVMLQWTGQ